MKMLLNNYENDVVFDNTYINTLEILNKKAFYQFLKDINNLNDQDNILFFDNNEPINMDNKIFIIYNFINFDFNTKKITANILNIINNNMDEKDKDKINNLYNKLKDIYTHLLDNIDINLEIQEEFKIEDISKLMKPKINTKNNLLENILLLIDIESELNLDKLVVFVNLKSYLENEELIELYKYSLYKDIKILLVDNHNYSTNNIEKKLQIDEDLIEFMLLHSKYLNKKQVFS